MTDDDVGAGAYVFGVRFRLEPDSPDLTVDPATFETTVYREAAAPGDPDWLFFRDNLWRGELNDPGHFRDLAGEALGVPVESVDFRELRATEPHYEALRTAIGRDLAAFNADTVEEVVRKYLGSSVRVLPVGADPTEAPAGDP